MIKGQTQEKELYKITIKTKPVVVSLFSGCGGLDLGFKNAGFDIAFANDLNRDSVRTYRHNIDKNIIMGDIKDIPSSKIPYNADVLMGGIPCQPFSLNNMQKSKDDGRAELYKEMIRVAKETSPKFVVIENVLGMKMSLLLFCLDPFNLLVASGLHRLRSLQKEDTFPALDLCT